MPEEKIIIQKIEPKINCIGYATKIQKRRTTFYITINRVIAVGSGLKAGDELFSYLCEDPKGRSILVTYLDGEQR